MKHTRAKPVPKAATMQVLARSPAATRGQLTWGGMTVACALGARGCRARKREGDGATPIGRWRLREVFYRADRIPRPRTGLPVRALNAWDGWCDAVGDRNYNRWVRHPYRASAEKLWRSDRLYDLVVTLDHNACPRIQGLGSAIFMHVAGTGYPATAGCVALQRPHLLRLVAKARRGSVLIVVGGRCKKRPE